MKGSTALSHRLVKDVAIVLLSILAAIYLSRSGFLSGFFLIDGESKLVGAFFAGILFTSLFTTPIAIALFTTLAPSTHIFTMAIVGALGAVLGDLAIFWLVRYTFRQDAEHVMSLPKYRRFFAIFRRRMFRWVLPFIGALIIASPFPDEIGIGLMGLSRMRARHLIVISFVMNAIGIACIGWIV